jgi:predicted HTH transcriptional regulator
MKIKVDFNKEKGGFSVVFWRKNNSNSTLTEISNANVSEKIIINYIYNNGSINRQQLISLLNISKSSAIRLFNKMVAKKIIKPQGGSKNIVYFLVENKK